VVVDHGNSTATTGANAGLACVIAIGFTILAPSAYAFDDFGQSGMRAVSESKFHQLRWNTTDSRRTVQPSTVEPDDGRVFEFREGLLWSASASDESFSGRVEASLLPFFNLYGTIGWSQRMTEELSLEETSTSATGFTLGPDREHRWLGYTGGGVVSGGWRQFFASVDTSFTHADHERAEQPMSALTVEPRVGARASNGAVAGMLWLGAMYRTLDEGLEGDVEVPGLGSIPLALDVDVEKPWNMRLGTELDIGERFSFTIDGGVTSRQKVRIGFDARF